MRLARLPRSWRAVVDHRLAPLGLTQTRWITLYNLWKSGDGQAQCDLARSIGVEAPSLVRTLDQLARQGLIERRPCGHDRRTKRIHLTRKAAPLIEQIDFVVNQARAEMLEGLSEEEVDHFSSTLEKIEHNSQRLLNAQQSES
ncbi:transcriptional regulator SlyA [Halotalea alkalilenta]|nr:transcriptional regulator SlyA [Halotalea alkalilenta]